MSAGFQENDRDSYHGHILYGSSRRSRAGFQENDEDSCHGHSLDGSFRSSRAGASPDRRSCTSASSMSLRLSRRAFKGLKYYEKTVIDSEIFSDNIKDWVLDRSHKHPTNRKLLFRSPFLADELCKLDYALEGVLFQQLFRMPYSLNFSDGAKECQFLALEDFLYTIVNGLWHTFWHKTGPLPFFVSCPRRPGYKFYSVEKAVSTGRVGRLCGAGIIAKSEDILEVQWGNVVELALFKADILCENDMSLSASAICDALFYGFHILLSRSLSKLNIFSSDPIYLLVLDSKYGAVVRFAGDTSKLETNPSNPYSSVARWIKVHAEVSVSPVHRIWNRLGNPNWGDLGTLHLLLATFNSIVQWKGPPRKSIASLAADHSLRLQRRRMECNALVPTRDICIGEGEIFELGYETDCLFKEKSSSLKLKPGSVVTLEDPKWQKGFQIQEMVPNGAYMSYVAISVGHPSKLLTLCVGAHPSKLESSWEAMSLWYQVQRQTKVLNTMKQRGISSKFLPEILASGRIVHPGPCRKQNSRDRCDHPLCGAPVLVTSPLGEAISSVISQYGSFSPSEALRLCKDCLTALRDVALAHIQHGDICPENILQIDDSMSGLGSFYVLVSWGHAILEDRDSPAMNLQFSSMHALRHRKLCPSSDVESLVYLLYFVCGGTMQQQDSIESALQWRERCWSKRLFQQHLGEVSTLLKAFADYVDSLCGTPYPVEYDFWLNRLNQAMTGPDKGKAIDRVEISLKLEDVAESSGTSGGDAFSL
uniref:Calcium and calcium/calmodulin-dependent serine/threonine-protein kinase n=1 Tax=Anthurium amnicola TaxID=1678845 RepID=A0A1D1YJ65_9ARAE